MEWDCQPHMTLDIKQNTSFITSASIQRVLAPRPAPPGIMLPTWLPFRERDPAKNPTIRAAITYAEEIFNFEFILNTTNPTRLAPRRLSSHDRCYTMDAYFIPACDMRKNLIENLKADYANVQFILRLLEAVIAAQSVIMTQLVERMRSDASRGDAHDS